MVGIRRIPSLDGARALSIALVITGHANWNKVYPIIWRFEYWNLGVRIFFVISGFLITTLLLEEYKRTGRVSLPQFYVRRAFRILPAAYVYVAVIVALIPLGVRMEYGDVLPVVFYYANYVGHHGMSDVGQFWSLSVEEQFYFLWPAALAFLGIRRGLYGCLALLILAPAFRLISSVGLLPPTPGSFETVCDALATGCLLAMLRDELWSLSLYRRLIEGPGALIVALSGIILSCRGIPTQIISVAGIPILNMGVAMLLDRYMRMPQTVTGRILNLAPIVWIGTVSYSLYLWQQPWMFSRLPMVIRISGAFVCAALSLYLVEKPMLRMRRRLHARSQLTPMLPSV
jgi:peptidoglycan/LPS O-acetylase OafA/YrhL